MVGEALEISDGNLSKTPTATHRRPLPFLFEFGLLWHTFFGNVSWTVAHFLSMMEAESVQQLEINLRKVGVLRSFWSVLRVLSDILGVLEPSWRLWAPGWCQRRANEGPWVLFWAILALSGAEMRPKGAILEVKWKVNESQNRSKTLYFIGIQM